MVDTEDIMDIHIMDKATTYIDPAESQTSEESIFLQTIFQDLLNWL